MLVNQLGVIIRDETSTMSTDSFCGNVKKIASLGPTSITDMVRFASLLPVDADASARELRESLYLATRKQIAVIITDTASVFGKLGGQDIALGCAGLDPVGRNYAAPDVFGNPKMGGLELIADPLAGLSGWLMGQTDQATPICLIRGFEYKPEIEEGRGIKILSYPAGVMSRSILFVALATLFYYLVHVLILPLRSSK
jgi:coenzyme F420-0:L-glutamate ligase / coenzyme F420-1:gamma-L-glutamate ligase